MKFTRGMSIVLISLTVLGWGFFIVAPKGLSQFRIDQHCKQAEEYIDRGLYQLAIAEYDSALTIEPENESVWADKLSAYNLLYDENDEVLSDYLEVADESVDIFPGNADFVLISANLHIEDDDYESAYKMLTRAVESGVKDERVLSLRFKTKYAFDLQYNEYTAVKDLVNNYFVVLNEDHWEYLDGEGSQVITTTLSFAGPVGDENIRFISDSVSGRNYLVDDETIIHGFFEDVPEDAGVYSEGYIAIKRDGKYSYYNSLGDIQFNGQTYEFAGTFNNGTAAVKQDGSWFIIDTDGNKVSEEDYDEILLNTDYTYNKKNIQILKYKNATQYSVLYKDKVVGEFDDVGVVTNDRLIAVCKDSKWGYINTKGEIVIDYQFTEARSFSNGLAAVFNGKKWGYINTDGELAIDYQFFDAGYFSREGCCLVITDMKFDSETREDQPVWQMLELYNKID